VDTVTSRSKLTEEEIQNALKTLPGWAFSDDRLAKEFELLDFKEAIAFIVRISFEAELMDHHPELKNVYNRVAVGLTTHDAGNAVTAMDVNLAMAIEEAAGSTRSSNTLSQ
jgi:4a-hydroxytetrahydrobiopterin dehydratase